jgi:predicted Fe-Mo cluster-binding NifX family protein
MRIALAVLNGRISPVFDVSRQALIFDSGAGAVQLLARTILDPERTDHTAQLLADAGVETLVCGAISTMVAEVFAAHGIAVIPFVAGDVQEVIAAQVAGELPKVALLMPGCSLDQGSRRGTPERRGTHAHYRKRRAPSERGGES